MPSDQSLAQLLKEARDFSDYQKVEARIAEQFISRDEAMGALLKLAARVEALESGQPEASPDPRPPTRPGDEFPTPGFGPRRPVLECSKCGDLPARTGLLNEVHGIGDPCPCCDLNSGNYVACIGRLQKPSPEKEPTPNPPSKTVPIGSLAAGTWFTEEDTGRRRQVISTSTNFGDVWVSDTDDSHTLRNGDWLVILDRPALTPNPPSAPVRVDSKGPGGKI